MNVSKMKTMYKKVVVYSGIISITILGILLSMLRLVNSFELNLARWTTCGILFCIVAIISVFTSLNKKTLLKQMVYAFFIPLITIILANIIFILFGQESLFVDLVMTSPFLPSLMVFVLSFILHGAFFIFNKQGICVSS